MTGSSSALPSNPATPVARSARQRPTLGIACCVGGLLAFAAQDTLMKRLGESYPVIEIITLRTTIVLVMLIVLGAVVRGRALFRTRHPLPLLFRGVVAFVAFSSYYLALAVTPLADAAAVYMTAPLFVTVWSVILLKEQVGWHRWGAVVLGFAAVIVMLNPGASAFQLASAVPMFSALCYAAIPIITRRFGLTEHPLTMALYSIMGYFALCAVYGAVLHSVPVFDAPGILGEAVQRWRPIAPEHVVLTAFTSVLFTLGLLCITQAYRLAAASIVAPFEYSYLVWATLLGFLVFGHVPGVRTVLGGLCVVACGCYVLWRERTRVNAKGGNVASRD